MQYLLISLFVKYKVEFQMTEDLPKNFNISTLFKLRYEDVHRVKVVKLFVLLIKVIKNFSIDIFRFVM
jgi:hypothetical protein